MGMFKPNVSGYNKYVQRLHGCCKESCFFPSVQIIDVRNTDKVEGYKWFKP